MKTLEHVFTNSRGQCSVHKSGNFSYPIVASAGDLVRSTDPIIKLNCCIKETVVADLNL